MSSLAAVMTPSNLVGTQWPGVGIAVIVRRNGEILLGRRGGGSTHSRGVWGMPGGKLDLGESFEACARRELVEETGLRVGLMSVFATTNDIFTEEGRHFVTVFLVADWLGGEAELRESEKMTDWRWFPWNQLPNELMLPIRNLIAQGYDPFC